MIIIRCVSTDKEFVPRLPPYREDVVWRHTTIPEFHWNPLRWFRFFRGVKSCMILVWMVPEEWSKKIPPVAKSFFAFCARFILKKPWSGPGIIFDCWKTKPDPALSSIADIMIVSEHEYSQAIKEAYFLGECGSPDSTYRVALNKERLSFLKKECSGKILEIGCATGYVLDQVGGGVGIDIDPLRVEYAGRKFPQSSFKVQDATKMNFGEREFDTVLIPEILEHVPFEVAGSIVNEAKRVGRKLVITVPNAEKPDYDKELVENPDHKWFPTKKLVADLIGSEGKIFESPERDFIYAVCESGT